MFVKYRNLFVWEKAFTRKLFYIAIPIVLQNLMASSLHIIDGLMVGQLGQAQYAGVVQANRFTFVNQLFLFGTISGCGIFFSQYYGASDLRSMKAVQGICLRVTLCTAALFFLAAVSIPDKVILLFLQPGESAAYGAQYLRIVAFGYLIAAVDGTYAAAMKSAQRTVAPMVAGISAILCNTLLNYALMFGRLGMPEMGVEGAALATVISAALSLAINLYSGYAFRYPSAVKLQEIRLPSMSFIRHIIKRIFPVIINEGFWAIGIMMYSVFYGRLGDEAVAAIGIFQTVDQLMFVLIYGLMSASSILVGNRIGAGEHAEAFLCAKRMLLSVVLIGVVMGGVLVGVRQPITHLFNVSAETRLLTQSIMLWSALFIWVRAFNTVNVVGVMRSGGDTVYTMVLDCACVWLCGVPVVGIAALVLKLPVQYVYLCSLLEEVVKLFIGIPRFVSGKWITTVTKTKAH